MSYIQVLGLRFKSQVLENVLDFGPMSQIYILGPRKCLRFKSQVLENDIDLRPKAWKWSQNWDLRPRKGTRFRSQVLDLGP